MCYVDVAVFAHNEQSTTPALISDLDRQSIVNESGVEVRIHILCNGCNDRTVEVAHDAVAKSMHLFPVTVIDNFAEGGKTLTWNRFVSALPDNSNFVIFVDGDIRIKDADALSRLLCDLQHDEADAVTSHPLKDMSRLRWNPILRIAAGLVSGDHRDGPICGQLYAAKTEKLRKIRLPVPFLVEDGFLSACLVTGLFSHNGKPEKVKASQRMNHPFKTPGSLRVFFQHDVRLRLGCELNAALYSDLWAAESVPARIGLLKQFSASIGVDRSIDDHLKHPERSALIGQKFFRSL
jgi:glycosyltransferase involved in cell wall biosynthesis